jgi:hypothetical protein
VIETEGRIKLSESSGALLSDIRVLDVTWSRRSSGGRSMHGMVRGRGRHFAVTCGPCRPRITCFDLVYFRRLGGLGSRFVSAGSSFELRGRLRGWEKVRGHGHGYGRPQSIVN